MEKYRTLLRSSLSNLMLLSAFLQHAPFTRVIFSLKSCLYDSNAFLIFLSSMNHIQRFRCCDSIYVSFKL
ncbi:hypothetical protein Plhal703r1_c03g0017361 [Plasmopara halstedii]